MRSLFLLISFLACCAAASAAERIIGYVEQEKPGKLIMVTVVQSGKKTAAVIDDFASGVEGRTRPISKAEFDELWAVLTGPEAVPYIFAPTQSDSMAEPRFFTFSLDGAGKNLSLRIPIGDHPKSIGDAIAKIRSWINEKG